MYRSVEEPWEPREVGQKKGPHWLIGLKIGVHLEAALMGGLLGRSGLKMVTLFPVDQWGYPGVDIRKVGVGMVVDPQVVLHKEASAHLEVVVGIVPESVDSFRKLQFALSFSVFQLI